MKTTINTTIEAQEAILALNLRYKSLNTTDNNDLSFFSWLIDVFKEAKENQIRNNVREAVKKAEDDQAERIKKIQAEILAEAEKQAPVVVSSSKHLVLDENCKLVEVESFQEDEELNEDPTDWEAIRREKNEKKAEAQKNMIFNPKIKFMQHAVTDGKEKVKVWYSTYDDGSVSINASSYAGDLRKLFPGIVDNDSDSQSDYFEKDSVRLFSTSPYYKLALGRAKVNGAKMFLKNITKNPRLAGNDKLGYGQDKISEANEIMANENNYLAGKF